MKYFDNKPLAIMAFNMLKSPLLEDADDTNLSLIPHSNLIFQKNSESVSQVLNTRKCFSKINDFIKDLKPIKIDIPFKPAAFTITKDERKIIITSREGRCAVVDKEAKRIVSDVNLNYGSIWTIDLVENDKYLLLSGASGIIYKLLFSDFSKICEYSGHNDEINYIKVSLDEKTMYSASDDNTVIKWDLEKSNGNPKTLYSHDGVVYCLDLDPDNKIVASGSGDETVIVYSLELNQILYRFTDLKNTIWCIKVSNSMKFIAAGDQNGFIHIWKYGTWEKISTLSGHKERVRSIEATLDESKIISSSLDNTIKIWDYENLKEESTLTGHRDWVKKIKICSNQDKIISISDDLTIGIWNFIKPIKKVIPNQNTIIKFDSFSFYACSMNKDNMMQIYTLNEGKELQESYSITRKVYNYSFSNSGNKLYVIAENEYNEACFFIFNLKNNSLEKETVLQIIKDSNKKKGDPKRETNEGQQSFDIKNELKSIRNIWSSIIFPNELYLALGKTGKIYIFNISDLSLYTIIKNTKYKITLLAITNDCSKLFSVDNSIELKVLDFFIQSEIHSISFEIEIELLQVSLDDEYLLISIINSLHIFSIKLLQTVKVISFEYLLGNSISDNRISKILFTQDQASFIFGISDTFFFYSLNNFEIIAKVEVDEKIKSFALFDNESYIIYTTEKSMIKVSNPIKETKEYAYYGSWKKSYEFINYAYSVIFDERSPEYAPEFDTWLIKPFDINLVHLYAYYNRVDLLKQALNNNSPFFRSNIGFSPLQICLDNDFMESIEIIYDACYKKLQDGNFWAFYYFGDSLISLNKSGFYKLHNIYEAALIKNNPSFLPKFCDNNLKLPLYVKSENPITSIKDFEQNYFQNEEKSIEFASSAFKVNIEAGSYESLIFLNSIIQCKNLDIFATEFIRIILKCKWSAVRSFMVFQTILYLIYLISLTYTAIYYMNNKNNESLAFKDSIDFYSVTILFIGFFISMLFFINEVCQMFEGWNYWTNFWNIIDLCRFVLFTIFAFVPYFDDSEITSTFSQIEIILFSISWIRGLTFSVHLTRQGL